MTRLRTSSYWLTTKPATNPMNASRRIRRMIRILLPFMVHYATGNRVAFEHQFTRPLRIDCIFSLNCAGAKYPTIRSISAPDASVKTV